MSSFVISLDFEDYLAANYLLFRRRWLWRGVVKLLAVLAPILGLVARGREPFRDGIQFQDMVDIVLTGVICASLVILLLILSLFRTIPRTAQKTWSQLYLEGLPTRHEFDESGIRIANERGTSNVDWSMLTAWIEDDRMLMMFRTRLMFHAVPKAQVPAAELQHMRELLVASGIPTRC